MNLLSTHKLFSLYYCSNSVLLLVQYSKFFLMKNLSKSCMRNLS
nr:MAG TPA: hypothetical protein [Caudoviricetes sp.]